MKITELLIVYEEYIVLGKQLKRSADDPMLCEVGDWNTGKMCDVVIESESLICCSLTEIKH